MFIFIDKHKGNTNRITFIVAPCIMESIYGSLTNKYNFYLNLEKCKFT